MDYIKKLLQTHLPLKEEEWELFSKHLVLHEFEAKSLIVREGMIAHNIYFIKTGLMRSYYLEDGKEINTYFSCDGALMTVFSSFITQNASLECLEAIEDTIAYSLSHQALYQLYQQFPKFERFGRILAEKNYLCILDRTLLMQSKTAKQRYLDFIENSPEKLVQKLPLYQIASFLGIAPESLSRIRRELLEP
ncbi:Crp/Fnr family transcriptional regulator [Aureispira anguillae]|uniref:Crp/Fnr family transcriptional regulator n=1 Tax=Aureispira anguillae TaxID=2864201 RepID=A0A916DSN9_9BACT|nr:Crp/Fnr family transcriptional regulator [Aureispira anguillae]BDS12006.1 Crp/Fnr family transcriptional regulator [Aureispira anguillae]